MRINQSIIFTAESLQHRNKIKFQEENLKLNYQSHHNSIDPILILTWHRYY